MSNVIYTNPQMMVCQAERIIRTLVRQGVCSHENIIESPEKFVGKVAKLRKCLGCQKVESSLYGTLFGLKGVTVQKLSSNEFSAHLTQEESRFWRV